MEKYQDLTKEQLEERRAVLQKQYDAFCALDLSLNMARGKPGSEQLSLSEPMLDNISSADLLRSRDGIDVRNYGTLDGIPEAKEMFAFILEVKPENIIIGGNASLNVMYDAVARCMLYGVCGATPWCKLDKVKFLCPSPGYDRHFTICESLGIEMIPIEVTQDGPNMEEVEKWVKDPQVKGIWCVPKYANPTGITYSDDVVKRFANLSPAAADFRIFWDNAYAVHHLSDDHDELLNLFDEAKKTGKEDMIYAFASTSKITFPGAGISAIAASKKNIDWILSIMNAQTIGHDKINQLRHVQFIGTPEKLKKHMEKHAAILGPKFDIVLSYLEKEIGPCGLGQWTTPKGGYFVSFDTLPGCASRVCSLCKQAGVVMTPSGATYPYGKDPQDSNLRIAPTYPPLRELEQAMEIFCVCVKLASAEKLLER